MNNDVEQPAWRQVDPWPETRHTLLDRLRAGGRNTEWEEFVRIYGPLILRVGLRAGLAVEDGRDVMQETLTVAVRLLQEGRYDRTQGRFHVWLRQQTRWRIVDHARQRLPDTSAAGRPAPVPAEELEPPEGVEALEDPAALGAFDQMWDEEWVVWRVEAALGKVKRQVNPRDYQIYDSLVLKEWPMEKVAGFFRVTPDVVYQVKHRVGAVVQAELAKLERKREGD